MCIILENQGYQNWSQYKCCILGSMYTVYKKKGNRMFDIEYHNNVLTLRSRDLAVIHLQFWAYGSWESLFPIPMSPTANF